jgi:hypothetical protein
MRSLKALIALFMLLFLAACTEKETVPLSPVPPSDPAGGAITLRDVSGLWLLEGGSMMSDFIGGLATYGITADVTAIQIGTDGTGHVWLRDRLTGTKDCVRAYVIFDDSDESLAFDFAAEKTTDVVFNLAINRYTYVYPLVTVENGWLGIADEEGRIALFSSQVALPDDVTCDEFTVSAQYEVPAPQFFSDLVHYNDDLIFNGGSTGQIETFSLISQTLGPPLGPTNSRLVQTAQDEFFWSHCGCGGSRDAFKNTLDDVVDTISSEDEMGGPITFRGMAYQPTTDRLWLYGRPFDTQFGQFFVMDTSGEPDIVEDQISFNRDIRALAFDGTDLWAVVTVATQTVVRIDPSSGAVLQSYEIPDVDVSWAGLEVVGGTIYMLGTDLEGNGVLYRLNTTVSSVPTESASNRSQVTG